MSSCHPKYVKYVTYFGCSIAESAEVSTHDELMARGGRYSELNQIQARAYQWPSPGSRDGCRRALGDLLGSGVARVVRPAPRVLTRGAGLS